MANGHQVCSRRQLFRTIGEREIPNGDPAAIFDRALPLRLEKIEKAELARDAGQWPFVSATGRKLTAH